MLLRSLHLVQTYYSKQMATPMQSTLQPHTNRLKKITTLGVDSQAVRNVKFDILGHSYIYYGIRHSTNSRKTMGRVIKVALCNGVSCYHVVQYI